MNANPLNSEKVECWWRITNKEIKNVTANVNRHISERGYEERTE